MGKALRILVTGAGGFVGPSLLAALRSGFPDAVLIGAGRDGTVAGTDEAMRLDLDETAGYLDALSAARPDALLHLAAQSNVGASFGDPLGTWHTNLIGTVALGEAMLRVAPGAPFLFVSSGEVYGLSFQSGQALAEDAPFVPANPYAASKAAADLAVGEMAMRGLRAVRLRAFSHTGPGQSEGFVVAAFAQQVARIEAGLQEPVVRTGALDRWRDFLDVRDVCVAYAGTLAMSLGTANRLPPGVAINICSGIPRHVGGILDTLLAFAGVSARVEQAATLLRPTDVERVQGNPARARQLLDWMPSVPWDATLRSVLDDWRARVAAGH